MELDQQLKEIVGIVREAGATALAYFRSGEIDARLKGDRDVVTAADFASERLMIERIRKSFPGDGVVAEEGGSLAAERGRRWYLDPVDGTLNFSRGIPVWSVSAALFEDDQPLLGVVYDPIRDEVFAGTRGAGVRCNETIVRCSSVEAVRDAVVHITVDFNDASMLLGLQDVQAVAPAVLRTRNIGSVALALAYVAAGRLDAVLHRFANTWDYGAGVLLVGEAGGVATGLDGSPFRPGTETMLAAATTTLHQELGSLVHKSTGARVE